MGYSCSTLAATTIEAVQNTVCTEAANLYVKNGKRHFFEISRREHADGSITGKVFVEVAENSYKKLGNLKIDSMGYIERWAGKPVKWHNFTDHFKMLKNKVFQGSPFVVAEDTPEAKEYDKLLPLHMRLVQLGLVK